MQYMAYDNNASCIDHCRVFTGPGMYDYSAVYSVGTLVPEDQTASQRWPHVRPQVYYVLVIFFCICLVWLANVFDILAIASRAFAAYHCLQAVLSAVISW